MDEQIQWEDRYDLNIDNMNAEHRVLIKKMNHLLHIWRDKDPKIMEVFDDFATYTQKHFESEEVYMESINYPEIDSHKLIHKNLLEKVGSFKTQLQKTGALSEDFFSFLKLWLSSHICGIDMKYSKFANQ